MAKLGNAVGDRTVAVIEESTENLYSFRFILQSLGYEAVGIQANAGLALALEKAHPAVVIVDMMLPGGVALDVVRAVRQICSQDVKILAVTADAVPYGEEEIRKAGANDVIMKPYTVSDLQRKLR